MSDTIDRRQDLWEGADTQAEREAFQSVDCAFYLPHPKPYKRGDLHHPRKAMDLSVGSFASNCSVQERRRDVTLQDPQGLLRRVPHDVE